MELNGLWYACSDRWKLNSDGELFDMKDAPFVEKPVPAGAQDPDAAAGRKELQAVLDKLNPAAGTQGGVGRKAQMMRRRAQRLRGQQRRRRNVQEE